MKTLDHAFNADGLRKSGAKLEEVNVLSTNEHNNCHDLDIWRTPDVVVFLD
jgi:hypothetical protein